MEIKNNVLQYLLINLIILFLLKIKHLKQEIYIKKTKFVAINRNKLCKIG